MHYVDLKLGKVLSEDRLERAETSRLRAVAATHRRRLRHRLGRRLVALGERLESKQARTA